MALVANDYRTLTHFINTLDQYQQECSEFFDYGLLDVLSAHLNYENCGITAYNQRQYLGCIGRRRANDLASYHIQEFYKRDQLSQFITEKKNALHRPIVRVTDVIPAEQYTRSEYARFLESAGLQYVAVMVFPQHRICFYKDRENGDFTEGEVEMIAHLHCLIEQKQKSFAARQQQALANHSKRDFMDRHGIGFIVFDEQGCTVEYNQTALSYLKTIFDKQNLPTVFGDLMEISHVADSHGEPVAFQHKKGFSITTTPIMNVDSFGAIKTHYSVSITREDNGLSSKTLANDRLHRQFSALTPRELEVLEAYCDGDDYGEIAKSLFISENTVRSHLKSIYRKLNVTNQRALIKLYCQYTLLRQ